MKFYHSASFSLSISLIVLILIIFLLHSGLPFDLSISDHFYNRNLLTSNVFEKWLWPKTDKDLTFWLHTIPKDIFFGFGSLALIVFIAGFFKPIFLSYRPTALAIIISLILIPSTVALIKHNSHKYCPNLLKYYGGLATDGDINSHQHASGMPKANCFPAAHPGPGFALMVMGSVATTHRRRWLGYSSGFVLGCFLSFVQIARGEHFLSHCIATFLIALFLCMIIQHTYALYRNKAEI
jgi:membrane-associated PAP2 superfamily phosphatase